MNNINETDDQQIIDKVLENLPTNAEQIVELPSRAYIYKLKDPTKPITIRPMNFEDEKLVASQKNKADTLSLILDRCVSNLDTSELISADKLYLLIKLREVSYGDDYPCTLICSHCNTENKANLKMSELPVLYAEEGFSSTSEVHLTGINKKAKVKLIRNRDEIYFKDTSMAMTHIWRFVEEIDGVKEKPLIAKIITKLPSRDIKKLIKAMRSEIGVNTTINFSCASCGKLSTLEMPITADFFEES